jgi:hypothetical protein
MYNPRLFPRLVHIFVLAAVMVVGSPSSVRATSPALSAPVPIPLADSFSWSGFVRYWRSFVKQTDHVVLVVLLVMVSALFIITRGKWLK